VADAYADLGEVLSLACGAEEAVAALKQALAHYERKGNVTMAERTRARLAEHRHSSAGLAKSDEPGQESKLSRKQPSTGE
jgi:hypothetical protein